jgi:hypothetical protein
MKLTISTKNPKLALDEYGNEFLEFKGDYYQDFLRLIDYYNYDRYPKKK